MGAKSTVSENVRPIKPLEDPADDLNVLRGVLLAPILAKEAAVEASLVDIQQQLELLDRRTADFSQVLASSIQKLHAQDKNLNVELEPEITSGLYKCFKTQPERMAEALYPILGPAVRKLIAGLFQSSAGDNGEPYEVEQLFLIHKETSVVLSQSILCADAARDADLVSGMLDAIRSFVQEAFALSEFDGMNSIHLGDLTIWVEWGPKAILAVVVRGLPDQVLQDHYAEVLRLIHERYETALDQFNGDTDSFAALELSGVETGMPTMSQQEKPKKPVITLTRLALAVIALMIITANHVSANRSWQSTLTTLADEPGIVVINENRGWSQSTLAILRDPLAASQNTVLIRAKIDPEQVFVNWHTFQSNDAVIVERRKQLSTHNISSNQHRNEP